MFGPWPKENFAEPLKTNQEPADGSGEIGKQLLRVLLKVSRGGKGRVAQNTRIRVTIPDRREVAIAEGRVQQHIGIGSDRNVDFRGREHVGIHALVSAVTVEA